MNDTPTPGNTVPVRSEAAENPRAVAGNNAAAQLKSFVERIETLEEEKKSYADDIREVYAEAKGNGYDVKALRAAVRLRKQDAEERKQHQAVLDTYCHALGIEW